MLDNARVRPRMKSSTAKLEIKKENGGMRGGEVTLAFFAENIRIIKIEMIGHRTI